MHVRRRQFIAPILAWSMLSAPAFASMGEGMGGMAFFALGILCVLAGGLIGAGVGIRAWLKRNSRLGGALVAACVSALLAPLLYLGWDRIAGLDFVSPIFQRSGVLPILGLIGVLGLLSLVVAQVLYWLVALAFWLLRGMVAK